MLPITLRVGETAFFEVMNNSDIWIKFKKYMFPKQWSSNFYNYKDGDAAASNGYLSLIKENRNLVFTPSAIDLACRNGHLEVAQYLYDCRREDCTTMTLSGPCNNGHLHIVKWLLLVIKIPYDSDAMIYATKSGNLKLVKWLLKNFGTYSSRLLNSAVSSGNILMVEFIDSLGMGYNEHTMVYAAKQKDLNIIKFLHEKHMDDDYSALPFMALHNHNFEAVKWSYQNNLPGVKGVEDYFLKTIATIGNVDILIFLYNHFSVSKKYTLERSIPMITEIAVKYGHLEMVRWIRDNIKGVHLGKALECAKENGFIEIVDLLQN